MLGAELASLLDLLTRRADILLAHDEGACMWAYHDHQRDLEIPDRPGDDTCRWGYSTARIMRFQIQLRCATLYRSHNILISFDDDLKFPNCFL